LRAALLPVGALLLLPCAAQPPAAADDPIRKAARDEVARVKELRLENLSPPYFVEVEINDLSSRSIAASYGGLLYSRSSEVRLPRVRVRVGSYDYDNSNYIGTDLPFAGRYQMGQMPLDDSYELIRRHLWLAIDSAGKSAWQALARKQAAQKSLQASESIPDFARAEPLRLIEPAPKVVVDPEEWEQRVRALSAILGKYPDLLDSRVEFESVHNVRYLVNSEGTEVRTPELLAFVRARVSARADDGMPVYHALAVHATDPRLLPSESELSREIANLGEAVSSLRKAPKGDFYSGPVVFAGDAAAQMFAQLLGENLAIFRKPVTEPGRPAGFPSSPLEGRINSRILPEFFDVVDDPTQAEWHGRRLLGHYTVDLEGVRPGPIQVVEKGVLKSYLLTRQPVRGFSASNGRARMPGNFGANQAGISNLFVKARETVPEADLKKQLIEMIQARNKPYGLLIRQLDFPSSASLELLRKQLAGRSRSSGPPFSLPATVYRVYPDGREELVRGLRFRNLSVRALKDIIAASDQEHLFEFLDSPAPLALMGAGGFISETAVVAPSVLVDDIELEPIDDDFPRPPIVPAPS